MLGRICDQLFQSALERGDFQGPLYERFGRLEDAEVLLRAGGEHRNQTLIAEPLDHPSRHAVLGQNENSACSQDHTS